MLTFSLNKSFERSIRLPGWLGVLTASLLYTDFRRVEAFEESMAMLEAELKKQAEVNGLDVRSTAARLANI